MRSRNAQLGPAVDLLRERLPDVRAIYVFGSVAAERVRSDSDIDIAVLTTGRLSAEQRFDVEQACAARLRADVDLVDLRAAPLTLQVAIVGEGRLLYTADPVENAFFQNTVLSRYCAFNEERRSLLEAISARGTIHA